MLRSLAVGDLSFGDVPFAKLKHSTEKNRSGSTLPLRSDLAAELRSWVSGKSLTDSVFRISSSFLDVLDREIEAASIPKVDAEGRVVHIHALRHSFATHLSRAGVMPMVAQAAMRHSNIGMTMTTYTDSRLLDTAAAVESLPTFDIGQSPRALAPMLAPNPGNRRTLGSIPDPKGDFDSGLRLG